MFGFDNERKSSFPTTLDFLIKNRIDMFICSALTPFPGTKVYDDLLKENRLKDAKWWLKNHNWNDMLFDPLGELTREEIEKKIEWIMKEFYKFRHFFDRLIHLPKDITAMDFLLYLTAYFVQRKYNLYSRKLVLPILNQKERVAELNEKN